MAIGHTSIVYKTLRYSRMAHPILLDHFLLCAQSVAADSAVWTLIFFCRSSSSTQLNVVVISFSDEHKHIFGPCIPFLSCLQVHGKATFGFPCGVCPKELCDSVDFPLETLTGNGGGGLNYFKLIL